MSYLHHLEPATRGCVKLHTSHGVITVHLWSAEATLTCRNFVQHAVNGTYDNLPFHRITADVIQSGDPTGEGDGGEAANGKALAVERHRKLKFRRRGLVAMVGDGGVRSQWFITLRETGWLDGAHSIFGCVGDGIFNMLELGREGEGKVVRVEVEENPFADIVKRVVEKVEKKEVVNAKRAVRRRNLLSFGDGEDSEGEGGYVMKKIGGKKQSKEEAEEKREDADAEIIRKANEEFERLKAAMLGTEKIEAKQDEKRESEAVRKTIVKKKRKDESETLRRLKEFEVRVRKERKGGGAAWFARGLKLGSVEMEEEEQQYEVLIGRGGGQKANKKR